MKPIDRLTGFWVLVACGAFMLFLEQYTASSIFMVGAVIFDALKSPKQ